MFLPFLPLMPAQLLLNTLLYDLSLLAIPANFRGRSGALS